MAWMSWSVMLPYLMLREVNGPNCTRRRGTSRRSSAWVARGVAALAVVAVVVVVSGVKAPALRGRADPGPEARDIGVLGTAEEVALPPKDAEPLERFRLLLRLDALRDHLGVHSGAHVEDGLHDLL